MRERALRVNQNHRSVGTISFVIFFAAGAVICLVTMLALAFPGGFLEPIWRLKPDARIEFQQFWGRIFCAAASMAGFPLVRSLSRNIPTSGILLFVIALLS